MNKELVYATFSVEIPVWVNIGENIDQEVLARAVNEELNEKGISSIYPDQISHFVRDTNFDKIVSFA